MGYAADIICRAATPQFSIFNFGLFPDHFSDGLFYFAAGDHEFVAAGGAAEAEVHADAQNQPCFSAAGMFFLQFQNVIELDIHDAVPFCG